MIKLSIHTITTVMLAIAGTVSSAVAAPVAGLPAGLAPVTLHDGTNVLALPPGVLPGDRPDIPMGTKISVFQAWRDNGNAWGYHVFLVTAVTPDGRQSVIGADPLPESRDHSLHDHLTDTPHTGDDALAALSFATARIDNTPVLLLIEAVRSPAGAAPAPAPTTLHIYRLVASDGTPGWTPLYFKSISSIPLKGLFVNAGVALSSATGLTAGP
ncbi:hypothetical protein LU298_10540 [Komagataeibacter intermedius]|uniref:Uncharacterized protein n=2 Tax=Komagataeibacter intermedius TaxID=66229 RepID=A0A0C1UTQ3_9PROT|nr:hypothetical protein [Komagataeibacter intermedius]KPH85999.1 hypothetical protein GLUCOINTEAF2_0200850 [Komagataeibacter intermedius AF2]KPH86427.1 hypothetical protein GLUCOINTEAF2_0200847 [Komagataeibacter intermedius AF2]KPH88369.1 hypothetical protein GLUCOINTEAF2_0203839 [Komagataeibacter intermedius AF2]MCF3636931.1 hypothetical protein [Komagataeibacter intermedius]GAN86560.1 hypothetical protein Gain_0031_055 [Komagataeibacter intermedius TF2]